MIMRSIVGPRRSSLIARDLRLIVGEVCWKTGDGRFLKFMKNISPTINAMSRSL
jgi:hypothetical protein